MLRRLISYALCAVCLLLSTAVSAASPFGAVLDIACAPTRPDVAAIVTEGAVSVTMDRGRSRRVLPSPRPETELLFGDEVGETLSDAFQSADLLTAEDGALLDSNDASMSSEDDSVLRPTAAASPRGAVDDFGRAAWWRAGAIYVERGKGGGWRRLRIASVRDAIFDASHRLLVLTDAGISIFGSLSDGARFESFVSQKGGIALFRGRGGTVQLLARDGIYEAARERKRRLALADGTAACSMPDGEDRGPAVWIVAASGAVTGMTAEGKRLPKLSFSASVLAVKAGTGGEIRFQDSRGGWRRFKDGRFQSLSCTVTAVDAAGRFWSGGPDGLEPPAVRETESSGLRRDLPTPVPIPIGLAISHPVPPRCRRYRGTLLPDAAMGAAFRRWGQHRFGDLGGNTVQGALSFGVRLTWRAGHEEMDACLARRERFHREATARIRLAAKRRAMHDAARARAGMETSMRTQIALRCEMARTAALLGLTGAVEKKEGEME